MIVGNPGDYHASALLEKSAAKLEARLVEFLADLECREAKSTLALYSWQNCAPWYAN
ncbi:MAG: hypothetical protein IPL25_04535 [Saprospiraceae bacterium]|nr:hypothetical protein [Candidatus Vicinibacter affinis]